MNYSDINLTIQDSDNGKELVFSIRFQFCYKFVITTDWKERLRHPEALKEPDRMIMSPGVSVPMKHIYTKFIKRLPMADVHPLTGPLDRLTLIGAIIAVATLWTTLWEPWKDLATSLSISVGLYVSVFLAPLVIVLVLVMWWVHTH